MFTFTNKEKQELLNEIRLLKLELNYKETELSFFLKGRKYYDFFEEKFNSKTIESLEELYTMKEENTILKAQNSVLSKLQDKEDEYRETITQLTIDKAQVVADNSALQKELTILSSNLDKAEERIKTLEAKIFEFKDPLIVRPEAPYVVEPVVLSSKK